MHTRTAVSGNTGLRFHHGYNIVHNGTLYYYDNNVVFCVELYYDKIICIYIYIYEYACLQITVFGLNEYLADVPNENVYTVTIL